MKNDIRPIGVFDSGLGGLTTVSELRRTMPGENIVYFGDTGRVPYGTRSREIVRKYARQDIRFLLSRGVKMIIAACNTASASILPEDVRSLGGSLCRGFASGSGRLPRRQPETEKSD